MSEANVAPWAIAGALIGAALGAYDGYKYAKKKNLKGKKKAAAMAGGALLGAVNPFKVVKTLKTGYKAYKASKYTKAALSAQKSIKAIKKVSVKAKPSIVVKVSSKSGTKPLQSYKAFRQIKQQKKSVSKIGCFTAGTKVYTEKGFKDIEAIKIGDYVWSENPETKEKALKKVNKIFVREKDSIIRLSINGETIETTHEHPFYVEGIGFVAKAELPEDISAESCLPCFSLKIKNEPSYPSWEDYEILYGKMDKEERMQYCSILGDLSYSTNMERIKMLGWADVIQDSMIRGLQQAYGENDGTNRAIDGWVLLLQLNSIQSEDFELLFGDCGSIFLYIKEKDLLEKKFDNIFAVLQC